ncbi:asparagine synthase-related protein [Streptomyces hydrogenans]|uniref:asparagine synthase-related protein n=1 Tax=Streptomyces hydrogenans TaxID=1873719 RepID=UPI003685F26A
MGEQWIAGGPAVGDIDGSIVGLDGVRTGPGAKVRSVTAGGAALAIVGDCPVSEEVLAGALDAVRAGRWEALTHWSGSYWVIADNGRERVVCGDLAGLRPVYYTPDGTWATDLRRLGKALVPDLGLAAARIVAGSDHWPGRSPYEGIGLVPGGFALLLAAGQGPRLIDVTAITPVEDLSAGAAQFGAALTRAVQYRVTAASAPVGADLSGGLDSSAAVVLAAQVGQVHAVTYTDGYTSAEDASFAAQVAAHTGVTHSIARGSDEMLPFSFAVGQPTGVEPAMGAVLYEMDRAYLAPVAGLPLHLTGHGGDVVLDATSSVWVRLLQDGQRRAAHRQVVAYARMRNMAPGPFWASLKETAVLGRVGALERAALELEQNRRPPAQGVSGWSWCRLGAAASWLTADGRAQVAALLRQAACDSSQPGQADESDQWGALRFTGATARAWAPYAEALEINPVHPYLDNTVVRAAFAVPAAARRGHYTFKPILAAGLPDLPSWLLGRRSKGSFTPQRVMAYRHRRARLGDLLAVSPLVTCGLVDHAAAAAALGDLGQGRTPIGAADMHQMLTVSWWLAGTHSPAGASC